jgi:hypothetical protein
MQLFLRREKCNVAFPRVPLLLDLDRKARSDHSKSVSSMAWRGHESRSQEADVAPPHIDLRAHDHCAMASSRYVDRSKEGQTAGLQNSVTCLQAI